MNGPEGGAQGAGGAIVPVYSPVGGGWVGAAVPGMEAAAPTCEPRVWGGEGCTVPTLEEFRERHTALSWASVGLAQALTTVGIPRVVRAAVGE